MEGGEGKHVRVGVSALPIDPEAMAAESVDPQDRRPVARLYGLEPRGEFVRLARMHEIVVHSRGDQGRRIADPFFELVQR